MNDMADALAAEGCLLAMIEAIALVLLAALVVWGLPLVVGA